MRLPVETREHGFVAFETPRGEVVVLSPGDACALSADLEQAVVRSTDRAGASHPSMLETGQAAPGLYDGLRAKIGDTHA